jgi:succinate-semialdehyde dehydrogenase / glutarate-semialdehyde dehydrogenase
MSRGIASINPVNGQVLRHFASISNAEIDDKIRRAVEAFHETGRASFVERARLIKRAAEILDSEKHRYARIMTLEMGKPLRAAVQEAEKCAWACRYYAENAARFLSDEGSTTNAARSFVRYQPIGPILAVMPWNFPFWQVFRFAAPALMAGNVGLLKHASNVPQCALTIEEIFRSAGFADGVFQTLLIGSDQVGQIIGDERVRAVTLTGSLGAGSSVGAAAGHHVKKTVLELGGSDPFIVMPSANLNRAVLAAVQARTINNGQSCIAAKRFILDQRIADEFERRLVERMAALKVGDPMDEGTDIGPLATGEVRQALEQQVQKTMEMGARLLLGGRRIDRPGYFFAPTVLTDVPKASPAYREELFGPVASLFRVDGMAEAIHLANDSDFGLGSCAWTNDEREQKLFVDQIEAGLAFVNGVVASDPRLPFGGMKQSGYGRELGWHGIREFVNIKTVAIYEPDQSQSAAE